MTPLKICVFFALTCLSLGHAVAQAVSNEAGTFNSPGYPSAARPAKNKTSEQAALVSKPADSQNLPSSNFDTPSSPRADTTAAPTYSSSQSEGQAQESGFGSGKRPLAKPSEFQKFVEAATGRLLPLFGSGFFGEAAQSQSSLNNVPVSADYVVGPGDEVLLRVWGSLDVDYRSTVDRNGQLHLPKVGSFNVAGVKAADLEKHLRAQIGRLFTQFNLSVSLGQLRAVRVFVVGPAQRPGVYTLASQSTMLSALVAAGGPAPHGSMRKVLLRRDGREISELDMYEFLVRGDKSKDVQLAAGDVVVFQPAGARVAVNGALDTPAIFELRSSQETVRELMRYVGGMPLLANPHQVQIERIDTSRTPAARSVEEFKLDSLGLQKPVRDGDVLTLLNISPQFSNAVTLRGPVAQPLRYAFKPGMRVRDLIPNAQALISPDFYRRKNLLVQVLDESEDGFASAGTEDQSFANSASKPSNGLKSSRAAGINKKGQAPSLLFDELNWDYAVIERLNTQNLLTQVIPFNLGKAVLQGEEAHNVELMAGDVITIYSQKDIRVPVARQTRLVSVEGEVGSPGVYQLMPGESLQELLRRAGGLTPQAYVYGLEFSREETRQRQQENLAAAIARLEALSSVQSARDAANRRDETSAAASTAVSNAATQAQLTRLSRQRPNGRIALELSVDDLSLESLPFLPLENADRIVVPSRPGFVTVAGAVVNSNAFLWKKGRTAGDYLKLAGADEAADPANMFILRADGTVSHAGDKRGFFGGSALASSLMQPGDALIVPNQLDFETWGRALVRNLKDWSQIFSQFGLGVAAINSIQK
jgi:polysaccharide biosynthesis/export protein